MNRLKRTVLLAIFLLLAAGVLYAGGIVEQGSGNLVSEEYDIRNFTAIDVSGSWKVNITRGEYGVSVEVDDNILEYIRVEKRGDTLKLSSKGLRVLSATFRATITMPDLEKIETSGSSSVQFSGFESPQLTIDSSGSSHTVGQDCTIGQLELDGSGSSKHDLKDCSINDVQVDFSGSTQAILTLTGGELTGKMSGSSSVTYIGEAAVQSVKTSGSARVNKE